MRSRARKLTKKDFHRKKKINRPRNEGEQETKLTEKYGPLYVGWTGIEQSSPLPKIKMMEKNKTMKSERASNEAIPVPKTNI